MLNQLQNNKISLESATSFNLIHNTLCEGNDDLECLVQNLEYLLKKAKEIKNVTTQLKMGTY